MTPETLVRDSEAPEATPAEQAAAPVDGAAEAPVVTVERPCPSCGAALEPEQDWCLECGSAATERSGGLPGWRTAAATIAICLTLASGAVAAAYAAMSSEDGPTGPRSAMVAIAPVDEGPDLGAAPALPGPRGGNDASALTDVPPAADPPESTLDPVAPPPPAPPVSSPPPPPPPPPVDSGDGAAGKQDEGEQGGKGKEDVPNDERPEKPEPQAPLSPVDLAAVTAATFDPKGHAPEAFTDPAAAIDGDRATAWTATLSADEILAPQVGVTLDLGEAIGVRRLVVTPTTPGTTIAVYGTDKAKPPAKLRDWTELATQLDVQGRTKIPLGDGADKVRHLAVVFVDGPVDGSTEVGIRELALFE